MKRIVTLLLCATAFSGALSPAAAETVVSGRIGMTWPRALLSTAIPSGDAGLAYGVIIDRKVAFGVEGDFLWNVRSKEVRDSSHYRTISAQKSFMFPLMGFFQLDPVPGLVVHPAAFFNIGFNSMIYSYTETDSLGGEKPLSPYFYGLIMKTGVDALYSIGTKSALFLGLEYRWSDMKTASETGGLFDKKNMGGIGLRGGFRVTM